MRFEVQAILVDVDGTLVDSTAAVERIWKAWAEVRSLDLAEILRVCHGRRSEDTIALFLPPEQRADAVAELMRLERDDLEDVVALPGARALLASLPDDRWAAVTSGSRALMTARLNAAGLPIPRVLVAAEDVSQGKPHPEGYRRAAELLGQDIRDCLVVEDAPAGLEAGWAAGARLVAVATTHDPSSLGRAEQVVPDLASCAVASTADGLVVSGADGYG